MEIRQIKKSEWDKLLVFNSVEYFPNHILTNKTYYNWQFDNFANPNHDFYTTLGLFGKNKEILGTFGRFSAPYNFYGKTVEGNCLCNLIVKKELRNFGYGYLLLQEASKLGDLAIDHSINDTAWPIFMKAGWQGENLKRYIYIINPKNKLYDLPISRNLKFFKAKNFYAKKVKKFDNQFNVFWKKVKKRYPITIERTAAYLNWRYAKNPLVSYHQFTACDEFGINGIAILRIEEVKNENLNSTGVLAGRIVDFISQKDSEPFLISKIIEFCRKNNIDFLDFFESGNFHGGAFLSCGFANGDFPTFNSLPILFNPISFKRSHLNFAVKKILETKLGDWYTIKGGGDMDRPR